MGAKSYQSYRNVITVDKELSDLHSLFLFGRGLSYLASILNQKVAFML